MYIVKIPYYSNDPFDRGWRYRYVVSIICYAGFFDYAASKEITAAYAFPEAVASWVAEQIDNLGENVEIEYV